VEATKQRGEKRKKPKPEEHEGMPQQPLYPNDNDLTLFNYKSFITKKSVKSHSTKEK
jgi:hypothetical protein